MTRLIEFLIALAMVLALFLIVGLVLPSKRHLVESVETNRKMTIVYDTLNNVRRLKDWNSLLPANPAELTYSGGSENNTGVGAKVEFASPTRPQWKQGSWEIVASEPPAAGGGEAKVSYAIQDSAAGTGKATTFTLAPSGKGGRNVRVTQSYDVDYGWNLVGRFTGMYVSRHVGDSMKSSLHRLANNLATIPNFDYRIEGSKLGNLKVVELPAEDLLVVNAGNIDRSNDAIKGSIKSNQEWIKRVMDANGLEAAGPVRIVTTDFGAEKYAFDVAQPVRKRAAAAPKPQADAAAAPEAAPPAAPGALNVKVEGTPVEYVHLDARRAASATYAGYMAELDAVRNALRAWAMTNGYEVTERPYESWKSGVDKSFTADGQFDLYWQVK